MANLPTVMELELAESQRNATRTPSPQLTPCEQLKYSKAQLCQNGNLPQMQTGLRRRTDDDARPPPDEPFYVRAVTELQDIEEAMTLAVSDIDSFEPCIIPGCPHHENEKNSTKFPSKIHFYTNNFLEKGKKFPTLNIPQRKNGKKDSS
ncbi:hypothetical protein TNCV_4846801 [Trichonephila clavipes]|nr:hypothetical protein TNCV_4846801 [Trichonephila clavipes]